MLGIWMSMRMTSYFARSSAPRTYGVRPLAVSPQTTSPARARKRTSGGNVPSFGSNRRPLAARAAVDDAGERAQAQMNGLDAHTALFGFFLGDFDDAHGDGEFMHWIFP